VEGSAMRLMKLSEQPLRPSEASDGKRFLDETGLQPGNKASSALTGRIRAFAVVLVLTVIASWIWWAPNKRVPNDLIGEWHSTSLGYSDRSFELDPVSISFGTGSGTVSVGLIKDIEVSQQGSRTVYTISYTLDDSANEVSFYRDAAEANVIRFKNQESIAWTKD